jgi:hypothetical protein
MKLLRLSNLFSLLLAAVLGVLLFWTSQDVQLKEGELKGLKKELRLEKETIRVLSVEWDYLNRPQRLEELARNQLGMVPTSVKEVIVGIHQIPEPVDPIIVPQFEEGFAQSVSFTNEEAAPKKAPQAEKPDVTVSPSAAEKQNFDRLIESLDAEGMVQ